MLVIVNILFLWVVYYLCTPHSPEACLELSNALRGQRTTFLTASTFFYQRAIEMDKNLQKTCQKIDELVVSNDFDQAQVQLETIVDRYPTYSKVSSIRENIENARRKYIEMQTQEAIRLFEKGEIEKAFQVVESADSQNPHISLILGLKSLSRGRDKVSHFTNGERMLLYSARNGMSQAMLELGKLYDPAAKSYKSSVEDAKKWYKKALEHGIDEAAYLLAEMLDKADVTKEAFEWMSKAHELKLPAAQKGLAKMYYEGRGVARDIDKAIKLYEPLAHLGDVDAQLAMGEIFSNPNNPQWHSAKAKEWYLLAAKMGNAVAQVAIARMYEYGLGGDKDIGKAEQWYRKAAQNGSNAASTWLVRHEEQLRLELEHKAKQKAYLDKAIIAWNSGDHQQAVALAQKANQDEPQVQGMLAYAYFHGEGVVKNVERAVQLAQKAINSDISLGYLVMAKYYEGFPPTSSTGRESSKEFILKCRYYERAAEGGIVEAQCKVAELCIFDRGFDDGKTKLIDLKTRLYKSRHTGQASDDPLATSIHNFQKARYWLEKAYRKGSLKAAALLTIAYIVGYGEPGQDGCGYQVVNCYGSIPKDRARALELIKWIREKNPKLADYLLNLQKGK